MTKMSPPQKQAWLSPWVIPILLVQAGVALWLGLPGQLSTDSIIQLYEGRSGETISFNPPLMSIFLGALDRLGDAPVGFVLISQALLTWCTWLVLVSSGKQPGWRYAFAAVFVLNPVVLAYVGIVWKDVLFAHLNILLFLLLDRWRSSGRGIRWRQTALLIVLLTLVVGMRQQGVLFGVVGALWAVSIIQLSKARSVLAAIALCVAPLVLNSALAGFVQKPYPGGTSGNLIGLKILMYYDLVGIVANEGNLADDVPRLFVDHIHSQVPMYTPNRVDTLQVPGNWFDPSYGIASLWWHSVAASPVAYFKHRLRITEAILGLSDMRACLVIESGIGGPVTHGAVPQELTSLLGLQPGPNHSSALVTRTAWDLATTPIFKHWAYALVLAAVCVLLVRRGAYVLLSLSVCSLILLGSYALFGIACDFRYAYTLTEATSLLAAWAMLSHPKPPPTRS